jgi:hypothetical protein
MAILPQTGVPELPELKGTDNFYTGLTGFNTPFQVALRRGMVFDHNGATRVAAQIEHDLGSYIRPAVGPVEYGEGNIKKSTAVTGPAGYNQRAVPLPESPDDMSQEQYMLSYMQGKPEQRERLRMAMAIPKQNFLNRPPISSEYPMTTHNMMNNLLALAAQKRA